MADCDWLWLCLGKEKKKSKFQWELPEIPNKPYPKFSTTKANRIRRASKMLTKISNNFFHFIVHAHLVFQTGF